MAPKISDVRGIVSIENPSKKLPSIAFFISDVSGVCVSFSCKDAKISVKALASSALGVTAVSTEAGETGVTTTVGWAAAPGLLSGGNNCDHACKAELYLVDWPLKRLVCVEAVCVTKAQAVEALDKANTARAADETFIVGVG